MRENYKLISVTVATSFLKAREVYQIKKDLRFGVWL